ncbi:MAG: NUDIX hydrolase [Candidatus Buchananbacteria bacterium]
MEKGLIVHSLIIDKDGKILIIKRSKENDCLKKYWDIPGGTLEDGEDPISGAVRETKEETGLNIKNLDLFHYTSNVDQVKNKQFIRLIFLATVNLKQPKIILNPREHDEYQWLDLNKITNFKVVDYLIPCLEIIKSKSHPLINLRY